MKTSDVKPQYEQGRKCPHCRETIYGNGFSQHVRACPKRVKGPTRTLYPVELPEEEHAMFKRTCARLGQSMAERVRQLVRADNRRNGD